MTLKLRAGLVFLFLTQVVLGAWILLAPRTFFALPWVNMGMAYNEHVLLDYGAMNLAIAVPLGFALRSHDRGLTRAALLSYLTFAVLHLLIHTRYLHHLVPAQAAILMTLLTLAALIPVALLVTLRRSAPAQPGQPVQPG